MSMEQNLEAINNHLREISDRSRRTETNLHKMREHLGIDGPTKAIQAEVMEQNCVSVHGFYITLSRIKNELLTAGKLDMAEPVYVELDDRVIAEIKFF